MLRAVVLAFALGIAACSSSHRGAPEQSASEPNTEAAGSGAFDPSLDTPRELREAGAGAAGGR
jgi:hypothetical protein